MHDEVDKRLLHPNGIDGTTGTFLVKPLTYRQAADAAKLEQHPRDQVSWLRWVWRLFSRVHLGLPLGFDPTDLTQAGWGIVFHEDESDEAKRALLPLIDHRRKTVGDARTKVLEYQRSDKGRREWLTRHEVAEGVFDPTKVPYYLLLVGSPGRIPFQFYHHLGVEYCVGWIDFDCTEDLCCYVQSLIDYETSPTIPNSKEAVFFAPRHDSDKATQLSADYLIQPLAGDQASAGPGASQPRVPQRYGFTTRLSLGQDASKEALLHTLNGIGSQPAFLMAASHGIGWRAGHPLQLSTQGALLCQDWPGIGSPALPDHYVGARDILAEARVHGLIAFLFACYGAGTPDRDRFFTKAGEPPKLIAERPFLAALPKALLSHRNGGALACVGHVERAWGYSITPRNAGVQLQPFESAIANILSGKPVGLALRDFNTRFASLSTSLADKLRDISAGAHVPDDELASDWIERNDAGGYLVFGDPAVRLRTLG
jgi:hypothetical protein